MPVYKFGTDEAGNRVVTADGGKTFEIVRFGTDEAGNRVFKGMESGIVDFIPEGVEQKPAAKPTPKPAFGKQEKVKSITLESEEVPPGPSQEDVNKVLGLSQATGMAQKPLGPSVSDVMAPAGSEAAMIQNVIRGKQTPQERIAAINSLQNTLDRQAQERQQEYAQQKELEKKAKGEASLARKKSLLGPVTGTIAQGSEDFLREITDSAQKMASNFYAKTVAAVNNGRIGIGTSPMIPPHLLPVLRMPGELASLGVKAPQEVRDAVNQHVMNVIEASDKLSEQIGKGSSLRGAMTDVSQDSRVEKAMSALPGGIASSLIYMGLGAAGGSLVGSGLLSAGVTADRAAKGAQFASILLEAKGEGDNVFAEVVKELEAHGVSREEAIHRGLSAADKVTAGNLILLGVTNKIDPFQKFLKNAILRKAATETTDAVKRGWAKAAGRTVLKGALGALAEGYVEERGQSAISESAKKEAAGKGDFLRDLPNEYMNNPQAQAEGDVGAIIGAITGGMEGATEVGEGNRLYREQQTPATSAMADEFAAAREQALRDVKQQTAKPSEVEQNARSMDDISNEIATSEAEITRLRKNEKVQKKGSRKNVATVKAIAELTTKVSDLKAELENHPLNWRPEPFTFEGLPGMSTAEERARLRNGRAGNFTEADIEAQRMATESAATGLGDISKLGGMPLEIPPFHQEVSNATETSGGYRPVGSPEVKAQEVTPDFWQSTRETWEQQKRDMATGAQDVSSVIKNAAELAYAIIKDLARGGVKGAEAFAKYARTIFDKAAIRSIEEHFGSLEALHDHVMAQNLGKTVQLDGEKIAVNDPAQWAQIDELQSDNKARIEAIKGQRMTSEERRTAIAESNKQYEAGLRNMLRPSEPAPIDGEAYGRKIQYLSAGLNPFQVVDQATDGGLSRALGIDVESASTIELMRAVIRKWGDIPADPTNAVAYLNQKLQASPEVIREAAKVIAPAVETAQGLEDIQKLIQTVGAASSKVTATASGKEYKNRFNPTMRVLSRTAMLDLRAGPLYEKFGDELSKYPHTINKWRSVMTDAAAAIVESKMSEAEERKLALTLAKGTLFNDNEGHRFTEDELIASGHNEKQIRVYNEIMSAMDQYRNGMIEAMRGRDEYHKAIAERALSEAKASGKAKAIAAAQEALDNLKSAADALEKTFANKAYWPLQRFGNYMLTVNDVSGNRIGMSLMDESGDANVKSALQDIVDQSPEAAVAINSGDFTHEIQMMPDIRDFKNAGSAVFDGSMMRYLTAVKNVNPSLLSQVELAAVLAYTDDTIKAHMQHRTGLAGYSTNLRRVVDSFPNVIANRIANLEHAIPISNALEALSEKNRGALYNPDVEALARHEQSMAFNPSPTSPIVTAITLAGYARGLGLAISSALTNGTQVATMGLPILGTYYGVRDSIKAYGIGSMVAMKIASDPKMLFSFSGIEDLKRSDVERIILKATAGVKGISRAVVMEVLHDMVTSGEFLPTSVEELWQQDRDTIKGKVLSVAEKVAAMSAVAMSKAEVINRISTAVASILLATKHGAAHAEEGGGYKFGPPTMDRAELTRNAERFNALINFTKNRANQSELEGTYIKGGWSKIPMQFKSYLVNSVMSLHSAGMQQFDTREGALNKIGGYSKPWAVHVIASSLIGGPMASIPAYLLGALFKHIPWDKMKELLDESKDDIIAYLEKNGIDRDLAERMISHGIPGLLNMDLSMALQPNIIFAPDNATVFDIIGRATLGPEIGAWASGVSELVKHRQDIKTGAYEAAKQLRPRAFKSVAEAATGTTSVAGGEEQLTPSERALRLLSVQVSRISLMRERSSEKFDEVSARNQLIDTMKKRSKDFGPDDTQAIIQKIQEFNAKVKDPKNLIRKADIKKILTASDKAQRRVEESR